MIQFPNRRAPHTPSQHHGSSSSHSSSAAAAAAAAVASSARRVPRTVAHIPLSSWGGTKVVSMASAFDLPPLFRGQPLSSAEIDAVLSGGANLFDVPKAPAAKPAGKSPKPK
jgi:hypothetical protein